MQLMIWDARGSGNHNHHRLLRHHLMHLRQVLQSLLQMHLKPMKQVCITRMVLIEGLFGIVTSN